MFLFEMLRKPDQEPCRFDTIQSDFERKRKQLKVDHIIAPVDVDPKEHRTTAPRPWQF